MRRNFADILKTAKIDILKEYTRLYKLFYEKQENQETSLARECEKAFLGMPFRGTCLSLTDFNEMATDIKMYKCLQDTDFNHILKKSNCGLDFYKNIVNEEVELNNLDTDYRFTKVKSYLDELNAIKECVINSAPKSGYVNEIYCPVIPLVDLNESDSNIHYFRDINGVFAQNIDTLQRSASYKSVDDITETIIDLLAKM